MVLLQLRGQRNETLNIYGMHVHIVHQTAPLTGALILPTGIGGGESDIDLATTLTGDNVPITASGGGTQPYFNSHYLTLTSDEVVGMALNVTALYHSYAWDLEIDYAYGNQNHSVLVNENGIVAKADAGKPFSVTALAPSADSYREVFALDGPNDQLQLLRPSQYCSDSVVLYVQSSVPGWRC